MELGPLRDRLQSGFLHKPLLKFFPSFQFSDVFGEAFSVRLAGGVKAEYTRRPFFCEHPPLQKAGQLTGLPAAKMSPLALAVVIAALSDAPRSRPLLPSGSSAESVNPDGDLAGRCP